MTLSLFRSTLGLSCRTFDYMLNAGVELGELRTVPFDFRDHRKRETHRRTQSDERARCCRFGSWVDGHVRHLRCNALQARREHIERDLVCRIVGNDGRHGNEDTIPVLNFGRSARERLFDQDGQECDDRACSDDDAPHDYAALR